MTSAKRTRRQREQLGNSSRSSAQVGARSLSLTLVLLAAGLCWPSPAGRVLQVTGQISGADQEATVNAISTLLKPNQTSACDGERLEIKCPDDYVIEIIMSELTILASETHASHQQEKEKEREEEHSNDSKVTSASISGGLLSTKDANATAKTTSPADTRTNPGDVQNQGDQNQARDVERKQRASGAEQQQPSGKSVCAPSARAGANYQAGSGALSACSEQQAHEASLEIQARVLQLVQRQCALLNSCSLDLSAATSGSNLPEHTNTSSSSSTAPSSAANGSQQQQQQQQQQQRDITKHLGQLLASERLCPRNRKLLELVYKCRPTRVITRTVCRGRPEQLKCKEPGKRLALGSAVYGFWPEDRRSNERCSQAAAEEEQLRGGAKLQLHRGACSTGRSTQPLVAVASECLFKEQCQLTLDQQLVAKFAEASSCRAATNASTGVEHASRNHLEYLKLIYICTSVDALVSTNTSSMLPMIKGLQRPVGPGSQAGARGSDPGATFVSTNVSSSSLLLDSSQVQQQQQQQAFISPPSAGPDHLGASSSSASSITFLSEGTTGSGSGRSHATSGRQTTTTTTNESQEASAGRVYAVIASDPQLADKHPSQWTAWQRVRFVLVRYQSALILFAVITITIPTLLAFLTRLICARRSSASSSKSARNSSSASSALSTLSGSQKFGGKGKAKGSSSSSASSSSSSGSSGSTNYTNQTGCTDTAASQQLFGSSLAQLGSNQNHPSSTNYLLTNHYSTQPPTIQQQQQQQRQSVGRAPTNSCSESCFSLQDELNNTAQHHNHHHHHHQHHQHIKQVAFREDGLTPPAAYSQHSPALQSNHTTPPCDQNSLTNVSQHHQMASQHEAQNNQQGTLGAGGQARPKLWSFYGNEQHSNSLRLSGAGGSSALAGAHHLQQQQQQHQQHHTQGAQAATLRPQRTFMGLQQPAPARNFRCLQQQQELQHNPGQVELEQHQSDYLLAMAQVGQQHHLLQQQPGVGFGHSASATEGWCPHSLAGDQVRLEDEQQLQAPQLHLLTLSPAELQQAAAASAAPSAAINASQTTCAFHGRPQPQAQQQQQQLFAASADASSDQQLGVHFNLPQARR